MIGRPLEILEDLYFIERGYLCANHLALRQAQARLECYLKEPSRIGWDLAKARIQYSRHALDAGYVIPDPIRDRHDGKNSFYEPID